MSNEAIPAPTIPAIRDVVRDARSLVGSSDDAAREAFLARKRAMLAAIEQDA